MKTKAILQVLAVCFSITLLSGYVIYAQRRAQPAPAPQSSPESAPGVESGSVVQRPPENPPASPVMASSSKRIGAVFATDVFPVNPSPERERSPEGTQRGGQWTEVVSQRADGSSVTTRVSQDKLYRLAPSSKVMISVIPPQSTTPPSTPPAQQNDPFAKPVTLPGGTIVRPETVHHGKSPALLGVIPSTDVPPALPPPTPAPVPAAPPQPRQTLISSTKSAPVFTAPAPQPVQTVTPSANSPQPRMIAPGSKSIDLLLFQKGTAPAPNSPVTVPAPTPPIAPQFAPTAPRVELPRAQQAPQPKTP